MLYIRLDDWFFRFYLRIPPVFRRFRRVFSSSSEEKYHKSEKNHKKPMRFHECFFHERSRIGHEKPCLRISLLRAESLCTSAPTVLRPRKGANPARKACLATSVFYTLLINIGSIVPGAPAALGIGAASFDGEGGDVDGKDTAESPTA